MGGANAIKGNWVTEKKTPQALGDAPLYENPELLQPYSDLLKYGKQNISLGEMIAPYYGGEETLKSEIEKAKASSLEDKTNVFNSPAISHDLGMKMDYDKIGEKIPVSSTRQYQPYYNRTDKNAVVQDPVTAAEQSAMVVELEKSSDPKNVKGFNKFVYQNNYTKEDYKNLSENPFTNFTGTLEHEVGHHSTTGKDIEERLFGATHMDKPVELANQLGRIQREAFYLYGQRFTPETLTDFMEQQKVVPEDERFQNFSPDTRRGLRKILDLHISPSNYDYRDYLYVKKVIPEFVKNETKPMSSYDAINAGLEEDTKLAAT
jgi:hypothetical protein